MTMTFQMGLRLYKPLLWKRYFDTGYSLTNYFFKIVAVFGLTSGRTKETMITLFVYSFFCLILGRFWLYSRLADTEKEISNMFDPFVKDMREKFGIKEKEKFK